MRMVAAGRIMLVTLWGLAIASVVAFPGQALVTRTAVAPIRFHNSVPSITMSTGSSGAPGRKKTTQIGTSSLPMPYPRDPVAARAGNLAASAIAKLRNSSEITRWRMAAATFVSSIVVMRPVLDASLVKVWSHIQGSSSLLARCFRHDHWEWGLAVACFLVWIHGFWYADKLVAKAGRQGRFHPWRKFRLQDRYEAQKLHHRQVRQLENGKQVDTNAQPPLVTRQSEWNWKAWIFELPVYILPLYLWDILIPRRAANIAAWSAPTTFQIVRDVSCGLLLYDLFFFCGHVLMHKLPFLWRVHKKHHVNTECRAAEVVRLSLIEEVLEVGMSIVALKVLRAHPVSRSIYNCIITFLLTELHCGFDFPWTPQNVVPFGLATGSRRHHYHHRFGKHYYQKFFCHVDRLCGFHQKDDGTLMGDTVQTFKDVPPSWQV